MPRRIIKMEQKSKDKLEYPNYSKEKFIQENKQKMVGNKVDPRLKADPPVIDTFDTLDFVKKKVRVRGKRYYLFWVHLSLRSALPPFIPANLEKIVENFRQSGFPSQGQLEKTLSEMQITTRRTKKPLKDFKGQLEWSEETNNVYWHLCLQTQTQTTAKHITEALGKALYGSDFDPQKDRIIRAGVITDVNESVKYPVEKYPLDRKRRVWMEHPDYQPGVIFRKTVQIRQHSEELIKDLSEAYQNLELKDSGNQLVKSIIHDLEKFLSSEIPKTEADKD